jgi:predicted RNA binding protein YcfA (HicA-like mRNA interferase family)
VSSRLRRLSGQQVLRVFEHFGFSVISQRGSHAKLRRRGPAGEKQTLTVPMHGEMAPGTLDAIFRQASQYIPEDQLRAEFYSD